jgi:hypothetical protein
MRPLWNAESHQRPVTGRAQHPAGEAFPALQVRLALTGDAERTLGATEIQACEGGLAVVGPSARALEGEQLPRLAPREHRADHSAVDDERGRRAEDQLRDDEEGKGKEQATSDGR